MPNMIRFRLLLVALLAAGCGDVKVLGADASTAASDSGLAVDVPVAADADDAASPGADTGTADVADKDAADAVGSECLTDFDCTGMIAATPCVLPSCQAGFCVKKQKATGATCIDPKVKPGECMQTTCDAAGLCGLGNRPEGLACGGVQCGMKCADGSCTAATDKDYDDGNPCTTDFCDQGIQVVHAPLTDLNLACDDKDACTSGDACVIGACKGQTTDCNDGLDCTFDTCSADKGCNHTPDNAKCSDGNPCTVQTCDLANGCTVSSFDTAASCNDSNACTEGDHCGGDGGCTGKPTCVCKNDADCLMVITDLCLGTPTCSETGVCIGKPVVCDGSLDTACMKNACESATGTCKPTPHNEAKPCDDGNACTSAAVCALGNCQGPADVACDDKIACTADACVPTLGCVYQATDGPCEDGNSCTTGDACASGGCIGTAKSCDDGLACTFDSCDQATGACSHATNDKTCDDNNPCTADSCDAAKGCLHAAADSAACDDGNACTKDACKGGQCLSTLVCQCQTDAGCNDNNPCTTDTCSAGTCKNDAAPMTGAACDSGDKCQVALSGVCSAGACKAGNKPIDCTSLANACNTATCNPSTGQCYAVPKGNGTACDADGNGCTAGDACQSGKCAAGAAVSCAAQGDACNDAACKSSGSATYTCAKTPKAKTTPCEDGQYCTTTDVCDGAGKCVAGTPRTCVESADACNTGLCDETKDACAKAPKAASIACDDLAYCTSGDHCDGAGKCIGGGPLTCPSGNCLVGKCDEPNKKCTQTPSASGAACTDGNACTTLDTCDATGKCLGAGPIKCTGDACNDASCNVTSGKCELKAKASTTVCDDSQACTKGDHCDGAGKCASGAWDNTCGCQTDSVCNDGNACTADKCVNAKCVFTIQANIACDDKNPCTTTSTCTSSGACAAGAAYDCSSAKDQCNTGACYDNAGAAACKKVPVATGTACSDGLYCTLADTCDAGGKCIGGGPPSCAKPKSCYSSGCTELAKGCAVTPIAKGTTCNDGDQCTAGENCDGAGTCMGGGLVQDYTPCDDYADTTSGDVCVANKCAGFVASFGPGGPGSAVTWNPLTKQWNVTASAAAVTSTDSTGSWRIWRADAQTAGNYVLNAIGGTLTYALRGVTSQVIVGKSGQVLFSTGGDLWNTSSNLQKSVASSGAPVYTDWLAVDTRIYSGVLQVVLAGHAPASGTIPEQTMAVSCAGPTNGASAFTCKQFTLPTTTRPVAAQVFTVSKAGCTTCVANPQLSVASVALNTYSQVLGLLDHYAAVAASALSTLASPPLAAPVVTQVGDVFHYDNVNFTVAGQSAAWMVGPGGLVAYQKYGSSGYFPATLTKGVQADYTFTAVTVRGNFVLVWGYKPDPKYGGRIPVLFTHKDDINAQSSAWVEHELAVPLYNTMYCGSNAASTTGLASGDGGIAMLANYCANTMLTKATLLRTVMYSRVIDALPLVPPDSPK